MDLSDSTLVMVSAHFVGNKGNGDELMLSGGPLEIGDHDKLILKTPFLSRFSDQQDRYSFQHPSSLSYNEVYNYCLEIFADSASFHAHSVNIAKHLYESTLHPKIKAGELYICLYDQCEADGKYTEAIGIYKTETKTNFLDLTIDNNSFSLAMREGVEASKFDKGCLVFPSNAEQGFDVLICDNTGRGEEAVFWRETFLNVLPQANEYFQTNQFLTLTKQFIAKQAPQEFDMAKTEQIDLLNKSVEYFRANESFDKKQFETEVLNDKGLIKSFRSFENNYQETNDIEIPDRFDISTQAVKKQARVFKSVLKLDKNFHVYIHGDKDLIEKGYDERTGKSFYKIYFDEET